jgi:hypothetical protein
MEKIEQWLKEPVKDWNLGLQLLAANSNQKGLLILISKKIHQQHYQSKLIYCLEQLNRKFQRKPISVPIPKAKPVPPTRAIQSITNDIISRTVDKVGDRFTALEFSRLPSPIQALEKQWKQIYKERAFLKNRLELIASDSERKEAAFQILAMTEQITNIHTDLDYFKKHGILPASVQPADHNMNLKDVEDELRRCRTRISKSKSKSRSDEQELKFQSDLKRKEELTTLRNRLAIQES